MRLEVGRGKPELSASEGGHAGARGVCRLRSSLVPRLGLVLIADLGFLIDWRYRLKRQGILLGSLATVVILAIDDVLTKPHELGCKQQFEASVRERVAKR